MNALAFSYHKTEQKNSIKAFVVSISTVLLLLLLIFFFKFDIKIPDDPDAPPYLSLVDFIPEEKVREYENAGGSKGAEGFEDLEGGSQGNQEQTPQPQPDPIAEDKVVEETPVEKIPPPSAPKPVVTTSEPDVVKLPTPPPINIPAKPSTEVVTAPKRKFLQHLVNQLQQLQAPHLEMTMLQDQVVLVRVQVRALAQVTQTMDPDLDLVAAQVQVVEVAQGVAQALELDQEQVMA
ncbi:MAG: hypothetical protein IPH96_04670 [Saprospiraceae bacterium]|nr:hypothetical protein [Saprospiraceae bacterium]